MFRISFRITGLQSRASSTNFDEWILQIKKFDDEVSAVFYKNSSSFALFDGKPSRDLIPYQSSQNFSLTEYEKDYICRLRHWCVGTKFSPGTFHDLLNLVTLYFFYYVIILPSLDLLCM